MKRKIKTMKICRNRFRYRHKHRLIINMMSIMTVLMTTRMILMTVGSKAMLKTNMNMNRNRNRNIVSIIRMTTPTMIMVSMVASKIITSDETKKMISKKTTTTTREAIIIHYHHHSYHHHNPAAERCHHPTER